MGAGATHGKRGDDGGVDRQQRQRVVGEAVHQVCGALAEDHPRRQPCRHLRVVAVGKREAVIDQRERQPRDRGERAEHDWPCELPPETRPQRHDLPHQARHCQQDGVGPVHVCQRCECHVDRQLARRAGLRVEVLERPKHDCGHQEVAERHLEAGRGVVDEGLGAQEHQERRHRHGPVPGVPHDEPEHPGSADPRDQLTGVVELAGDRGAHRQQRRPQRVRERLHTLGGVEGEPVAVQEIPRRAIADERVVAGP